MNVAALRSGSPSRPRAAAGTTLIGAATMVCRTSTIMLEVSGDMTDWPVAVGAAALALSLLSLAGSVLVAIRSRRQLRACRARIEGLSRDLAALCAAESRAGDRLMRLQAETQGLRERQEQADRHTPSGRHYRQAIALVQHGARPDELVATCGLAPGEADLVYMLHAGNEKKKVINKKITVS